MILLALVLLSAQADDIVVQARKLRTWRAVLVVGKDDSMTCRIVRSTGDAALDVQACAAQKQCYVTARPAILAAGRQSARTRRRAMAAVNRDLAACFDTVSGHIAAYPLAE